MLYTVDVGYERVTSNCIQRLWNRGDNGAFDRPRNAETAGTRSIFLPFMCFTNLLNMKFVIAAYKRILRYIVFNCIIVSGLGIYAEFLFPVV